MISLIGLKIAPPPPSHFWVGGRYLAVKLPLKSLDQKGMRYRPYKKCGTPLKKKRERESGEGGKKEVIFLIKGPYICSKWDLGWDR